MVTRLESESLVYRMPAIDGARYRPILDHVGLHQQPQRFRDWLARPSLKGNPHLRFHKTSSRAAPPAPA